MSDEVYECETMIPPIYGRWVGIKQDPNDPHISTIMIYRHKPLGNEWIEDLNYMLMNKEVKVFLKYRRGYEEAEEALRIAAENKNQRKLQ